jgi:hypothetical protein
MAEEKKPQNSGTSTSQPSPKPVPPQNLEFRGGGEPKEKIVARDEGKKKE